MLDDFDRYAFYSMVKKKFYNEFLARCIAVCFHVSFLNDVVMPDPNPDSDSSSEDEGWDEDENGGGDGDDNGNEDSNPLVR